MLGLVYYFGQSAKLYIIFAQCFCFSLSINLGFILVICGFSFECVANRYMWDCRNTFSLSVLILKNIEEHNVLFEGKNLGGKTIYACL